VVVFPQPFGGPPIEQPKTALKRIGFFGHQRWEKGPEMLEPLIARLVQDGYAITYQSSNPLYKGPEHSQVEQLGFVEDIATPIRTCDLVVLPYDVEQYKTKGSGILAQCLALGIPVTAPFGTLPGRLVERYGLGPLFTAPTQHVIYKAVKAADQNYAVFAGNALTAAHQFNQRNGIARFAATFLASGQELRTKRAG